MVTNCCPTSRSDPAAAADASGRLWIFGGYDGMSPLATVSAFESTQ